MRKEIEKKLLEESKVCSGDIHYKDAVDIVCSLLDKKLADIFHSDNPFEGIAKLREEIKGE